MQELSSRGENTTYKQTLNLVKRLVALVEKGTSNGKGDQAEINPWNHESNGWKKRRRHRKRTQYDRELVRILTFLEKERIRERA